MERITVRSRQPNDLPGAVQQVWESSEFQVYLATQLGPENYGQILSHMSAEEKEQSIAHFLEEQANKRKAEAAEREQLKLLLQNPTLIEIDPIEYLKGDVLAKDLAFILKSTDEVNFQAKDELQAAYVRLRSFLDTVQKRAPSLTPDQAQAFLDVLTKITKQQVLAIGKNQYADTRVRILIPGLLSSTIKALQISLSSPQQTRQEPPWTSPRLSSEEALEIARERFFSLAEYGILTGADRKKFGVASSDSVDAKESMASIFASDDVKVDIILSTRDADPILILNGQLDDLAKGWLHIALENPTQSINDLKLVAGPTELKAVCEYRVLNTVMCVMSQKSLTTTNAIIGQAPSTLNGLISERESSLNPRYRADNKNTIHECPILSSIAPKGFVALLVPEPLMGIAAQVAIYFARQGLQISFYPVPLTSCELRLGGQRTLSYSVPNYNPVLANICNTLLDTQPVIFHIVRLQKS